MPVMPIKPKRNTTDARIGRVEINPPRRDLKISDNSIIMMLMSIFIITIATAIFASFNAANPAGLAPSAGNLINF